MVESKLSMNLANLIHSLLNNRNVYIMNNNGQLRGPQTLNRGLHQGLYTIEPNTIQPVYILPT